MITLGVTDGSDTISVSVITRAVDTYDENGNGVKGDENDPVAIEADVQPANGRVLADLPEGVRDQVENVMWTDFDLQLDHVIVYKNERHRVVMIDPRREDDFTKAAISRIKVPAI